jgi:hypothetical protein
VFGLPNPAIYTYVPHVHMCSISIPMKFNIHRRGHARPLLYIDDGGSRCVSRKLIGSLGFSRRGVFIGEGAASEVDQGGHTRRGRGLAHVVWPARGPSPSPLRTSGSFDKFLDVRLLFRPISRIFPV